MAYLNTYSNDWLRAAYREGFRDGKANVYRNPYKGIFGGDLDRISAYDEGYRDGQNERWGRG